MGRKEFEGKWLTLAGNYYRVAYYILESQEDAEDAVQDLFTKLWRMREMLGGVRNPLSFGIAVIRNICIDRLRSKSSSGTVIPSPEIMNIFPDPDEDIDRQLAGRENLGKIRSCMARLPSMQREVLEMRLIHGLSFAEISRAKKISPNPIARCSAERTESAIIARF